MIASLPTGTPAEILVLLASHTVPLSAGFIARRLGRNVSTVRNALNRLRMGEHIERHVGGIAYRYSLTEATRQNFALGFAVGRAA